MKINHYPRPLHDSDNVFAAALNLSPAKSHLALSDFALVESNVAVELSTLVVDFSIICYGA